MPNINGVKCDALDRPDSMVWIADGDVCLDIAVLACQTLVAAYEEGEQRGGSIEWEDLNQAYDIAKRALPNR